MKTIKLLSVAFVSSALLTTACTPRDVKVVDDTTRAKILQKKNSRGAGAGGIQYGAASEFKIGMYSMSTFLVEKQVEAIELVRLALGKTDAIKTQYQVSDKTDKETGSTVKIAASGDTLLYKTDISEYNVKLSKSFDAAIVGTVDDPQSVEIKGTNLKTTTDDAQRLKQVFINYTENTYQLNLIKGEQEGTVKITVNSVGSFFGSLGGKKTPVNVTVDLAIVVDAESLVKSDDVTILSLDAKAAYQGNNGKDFTTAISGQNVALQASGLCNSLTGSATILNSGGKGGKANLVVSFADKAIKVGDKWNHVAAECGSRPNVDVARLLVY